MVDAFVILTFFIPGLGKTYEEIGTLYQNQSKYDWNPLLDGFNEYKSKILQYL